MTLTLWANDLNELIDLRIERKVFGKHKNAKIKLRSQPRKPDTYDKKL